MRILPAGSSFRSLFMVSVGFTGMCFLAMPFSASAATLSFITLGDYTALTATQLFNSHNVQGGLGSQFGVAQGSTPATVMAGYTGGFPESTTEAMTITYNPMTGAVSESFSGLGASATTTASVDLLNGSGFSDLAISLKADSSAPSPPRTVTLSNFVINGNAVPPGFMAASASSTRGTVDKEYYDISGLDASFFPTDGTSFTLTADVNETWNGAAAPDTEIRFNLNADSPFSLPSPSNATPEPTTFVLLGGSFIALSLLRRKTNS